METSLEEIKLAFEESGWSKEKLAKACGDSRGYVTNVLNGKRKATPAVLTRMAQALGLLPSETDFRSVIPVPVRFTRREWASICAAYPEHTPEQVEIMVREYLLDECRKEREMRASMVPPLSEHAARDYGEQMEPFA